MPKIYAPAEDSYLMQKVLRKQIPKLLKTNSDLKVLEIGSGSGVQMVLLQELGARNIFSVDINPDAAEQCRKLGFNCIQSDLFEKVKEKYDLIIFNPPYLPENKYDGEKDITGGKNGSEIINRFLSQAKRFLNKDGRIFLLTSSLTHEINFLDYKKELLEIEKLFMEELFAWEIWI